LTAEIRPPVQEAFKMRIELPNRYPPALAGEIVLEVQNSAGELLRLLGYALDVQSD